MRKKTFRLCALALGLALMAGCAQSAAQPVVQQPTEPEAPAYTDAAGQEQADPEAPAQAGDAAQEETQPEQPAQAGDAAQEEETQPEQPAQAGGAAQEEETQPEQPVYIDAAVLEDAQLEAETVALSAAPAAVPEQLNAEASGELTKKVSNAVIDYSNTEDGYVMVQYTADTTKRLKAQVKGPTTTYTYNVNPKEWTVFPLSDGDGKYQVSLFENVKGTSYAAVVSLTHTVKLKDEFAPYLRPNQYVDYAGAEKTIAKAAELTRDITDPLKKVEAVYTFVVKSLTYDKEKAATVQSGYLPVLDKVLEEKKGICFDYAALMTGMLRSQGVPCKLVVGYAGTAYHAWISVWSEETGWVDGAIYFDGTTWQRMDPTFASSANQSESIMAYIGDGKNYTTKYLY